MKPTSSFRLSKTTKRMVALMRGTDADRNHYKRMMIDAELTAEHAKKTAGKRSRGGGSE